MSERDYIAVDGCLTVAELREVLATANDDDSVHLVAMASGGATPIKAAMLDMEGDSGVMLYTENAP